MKITRLRLQRVVDVGAIVSLHGIELGTGHPVTVHLTYSASADANAGPGASRLDLPMMIDAESLVLSIDVTEDPSQILDHHHAGGGSDAVQARSGSTDDTPENAGAAGRPNQVRDKRFEKALYIVNPGASNPSGIAHAIIEACQEARDEGIAPARDAAVRLMVTQLAWVCRADSDTDDYGLLLAECLRRTAGA